jgi:hypothetical protein
MSKNGLCASTRDFSALGTLNLKDDLKSFIVIVSVKWVYNEKPNTMVDEHKIGIHGKVLNSNAWNSISEGNYLGIIDEGA